FHTLHPPLPLQSSGKSYTIVISHTIKTFRIQYCIAGLMGNFALHNIARIAKEHSEEILIEESGIPVHHSFVITPQLWKQSVGVIRPLR
ncbi:MAG: hypothetical protein U9N35_03545, partial [Euryarchaeota archaeon]|nr:hypothetical protein [Euryarchaeota archaeon]